MSIPEIHIHIHDGADEARVTALEEDTMTLKTDLEALTATVDAYNEDVQFKIAALQAVIDEVGAPDEVRAAFAALKTSVEAGVTAVGDANADGTPAAEVPPAV